MEQVTIFTARKARAGFPHAGQVAMAHHQSVRKEPVQLQQQFRKLHFLLLRAGVGRIAGAVQPALIADADAATVVTACVRPYLQQAAVLRHDAAPADVEMVAHGAESPRLVVTEQLFHGIVAVTTGGGAVDDEEADTVRPVHHQTAFHLGQQCAFGGHLITADGHGKRLLYHRRKDLKVRHTRRYTQCGQCRNNGLNHRLKDFHPVDFARFIAHVGSI